MQILTRRRSLFRYNLSAREQVSRQPLRSASATGSLSQRGCHAPCTPRLCPRQPGRRDGSVCLRQRSSPAYNPDSRRSVATRRRVFRRASASPSHPSSACSSADESLAFDKTGEGQPSPMSGSASGPRSTKHPWSRCLSRPSTRSDRPAAPNTRRPPTSRERRSSIAAQLSLLNVAGIRELTGRLVQGGPFGSGARLAPAASSSLGSRKFLAARLSRPLHPSPLSTTTGPPGWGGLSPAALQPRLQLRLPPLRGDSTAGLPQGLRQPAPSLLGSQFDRRSSHPAAGCHPGPSASPATVSGRSQYARPSPAQ